MTYSLFVTCPAGLETLLLNELKSLGVSSAQETVTGVICEGELDIIYRACLWSRYANRVLLMLVQDKPGNATHIYDLASEVPWSDHFSETMSFKVDFSGSSDAIRHTQYGARLIKDAVVDHFRARGSERPNVSIDDPDIRINVRLTRKHIYIGLDMSGDSLHKRGYRVAGGIAPIKENLAAALLARAEWPDIANNGGAYVDPMCGSGTFLIEAALMQLNIAPGVLRPHFGFHSWLKHDATLWSSIKEAALLQRKEALVSPPCTISGCELAENIYEQALRNIEYAGLQECIHIENADLDRTNIKAGNENGLALCNPPYGMRLGEPDKLSRDYRELAQVCKERFPGWRLGLLSSNSELLAETRLRTDKKYKIFNGAIACEFRLYSLRAVGEESKTQIIHRVPTVEELSPGALMVANRLQKNIRKLKSWRSRNNVECYRIYDADIPEYSAAVDVYGELLHIQEYQAPKNVDSDAAALRLKDLVRATQAVFKTPRNSVFVKQRKVNKGKDQYQKLDEVTPQDFSEVTEFNARLMVNLRSYLDTGLFLDHRPLRKRIAEEAKGKNFLNLFSYTSTATVHAILAGATRSISVDMSNTYIDWSKRNFELNNIHSTDHKLLRANVLEWLNSSHQGFDLIMLDPPSFSNSKKMHDTFDVQRDHVALVKRCMEILLPGGTLYFSNNFRRFILSDEISDKYCVENISKETLDPDFSRNSKIHHCFKIEHKK